MENTENAVAQTEVVLAALREPALKLLEEGIASSYTSTARRTKNGLEISTVKEGEKTASLMIVQGNARAESRIAYWQGIHLDVVLNGQYKITHKEAGKTWQETDSFRLSGSMLDEWMGRPDKYNVTLNRKDAAGKPLQSYLPAISEAQKQLDPNGQPLRLARYAGSEANSSLEDIYSYGSRKQEANYIIQDGRTGKELSYNETREKYPAAWAYRSVLRDMQGKVLGIVHQSFKLDEKGDLVSVDTSARKPMKLKH